MANDHAAGNSDNKALNDALLTFGLSVAPQNLVNQKIQSQWAQQGLSGVVKGALSRGATRAALAATAMGIDTWLNDEESDFAMAKKTYMAMGLSEEKAVNQIKADCVRYILGEGVSGASEGAVSAGLNIANQRNLQKRTQDGTLLQDSFAQQEQMREQAERRDWMRQELQGELSVQTQADIAKAANKKYEELLEKEQERAKIEYADGWSQASRLEYKPTSGAILKATPEKTTTVLGKFGKDTRKILQELGNTKTTYKGPRTYGFNLLNTPDEFLDELGPIVFWEQYNKPWLDAAIARDDVILLATEPTESNLYVSKKKDDNTLSGFGREYFYLLEHGYTYDPLFKRMIKKER